MIALSTGSLHTYGITRIFALAAEAGYDGIEVVVDRQWDSHQPAYLRNLVADHGLPILAFHSPFPGLDVCGWTADTLKRLEHTVALARGVGVPTVVTHLPFRVRVLVGQYLGGRSRHLPLPWPGRGPYYRFMRNGLAEFEAEAGVTIAVENLPSRKFLGLEVNAWHFNTLSELVRFPHLTLDTTHLGTWGLDPLAVYERLRERIVHVHLSNFDGREHRSPPDGHLPLAELLRRMARDGYQGVITVETSPDALDAEDEKKCLAALRRALAFCREHFKY
ncbi:MAG: sugar phosphate isomerase/epimerase [Anaerolineae bacterium]|nr:sugar phosphate isomerase/epimerase [Anaerolineae bacterium]